jgi:hypothetical protein
MEKLKELGSWEVGEVGVSPTFQNWGKTGFATDSSGGYKYGVERKGFPQKGRGTQRTRESFL